MGKCLKFFTGVSYLYEAVDAGEAGVRSLWVLGVLNVEGVATVLDGLERSSAIVLLVS